MRRALQLAALLLFLGPLAVAQQPNTCLDCHAEFPEPTGFPREKFANDVHAQKGLTCASCHGGDSSKTTPEEAMSPAAGFRGHYDGGRGCWRKLVSGCRARGVVSTAGSGERIRGRRNPHHDTSERAVAAGPCPNGKGFAFTPAGVLSDGRGPGSRYSGGSYGKCGSM